MSHKQLTCNERSDNQMAENTTNMKSEAGELTSTHEPFIKRTHIAAVSLEKGHNLDEPIHSKEKYMCNNVLLAGGSKISRDALASHGMNVHTVWNKWPVNQTIPLDVDAVVLVSDDSDRFLTKYVRDLCEKELIPLVYTRSDLTNFNDSLQKAVEVVTQLEEKSMVDDSNSWENSEEAQMAKQDGRSTGVNHQRAQEKINYVRELLAKDAKTPTKSLNEEVQKKFGKTLTPTTIAQIRWSEFGIKYGPRGKLITKGEKRSPAKEAVAMVSPQPDRLTAILADLRKAMHEAQVTFLQVPAEGEVRATRNVPQEITLQLH